jgi:hypothetical protein
MIPKEQESTSSFKQLDEFGVVNSPLLSINNMIKD